MSHYWQLLRDILTALMRLVGRGHIYFSKQIFEYFGCDWRQKRIKIPTRENPTELDVSKM